jgi:hypothetical protein
MDLKSYFQKWEVLVLNFLLIRLLERIKLLILQIQIKVERVLVKFNNYVSRFYKLKDICKVYQKYQRLKQNQSKRIQNSKIKIHINKLKKKTFKIQANEKFQPFKSFGF